MLSILLCTYVHYSFSYHIDLAQYRVLHYLKYIPDVSVKQVFSI